MEGKRFGKYVITKEVEDPRTGKYYECKCDCGTINVKNGALLRAGRARQCLECYRSGPRASRSHIPMIGKKFWKYTVLSEVDDSRQGRYYECMCECGAVRVKKSADIRRNQGNQCLECFQNERFDHSKEIGKKYGRWTVLECSGVVSNGKSFKVECECGAIRHKILAVIKKDGTRQCRTCSNKEKETTHGLSNAQLYRTWINMKKRCIHPNAQNYHRYGGRGIKVCDRWMNIENFIKDMGVRPPGMTIDRIDNDGDYEPSNCRWATPKENSNNRSCSSKVEKI